jgi:L-ascorbate metabolism protein UlaG (beta-lactamase superfamily)
MIKPLKQDKVLLREMNETQTPAGTVAFWWLGQNGFAMKMGETVIYIDPYLSDYCREHHRLDHTRLTEIPIRPELVDNAAILMFTHDHMDHLDPDTVTAIAQASPESICIAPPAAKRHLLDLGVASDRIFPTNAGKILERNGILFHSIAAKHEEFDKDEKLGYPYQSYVIQYGSIALFHAGDGIPYEGLADILLPYHIDMALLPINGRDEHRKKLGIKGNFTYEEAVQLAWKIKAQTVIPMHYDMFAVNTESVDAFTSYLQKTYPLQKYNVMQCGQKYLFTK